MRVRARRGRATSAFSQRVRTHKLKSNYNFKGRNSLARNWTPTPLIIFPCRARARIDLTIVRLHFRACASIFNMLKVTEAQRSVSGNSAITREIRFYDVCVGLFADKA